MGLQSRLERLEAAWNPPEEDVLILVFYSDPAGAGGPRAAPPDARPELIIRCGATGNTPISWDEYTAVQRRQVKAYGPAAAWDRV